MNVKMFNNDVDFFIFTTNKNYATRLKEFCTTIKSKDYWQKVIDLLQTNNIESNFNVDYNENSCAIDILNEFKLADDELAYYIDSDGNIIENFLPFDNARLNALIKNNIAPYNASLIGIFKITENTPASEPSGYILLNSLKREFNTRLYRVGLMSDIHYEDTDMSDHGVDPDNHTGGSNQPVADIKQVLNFYQNKEDIKFVCCSGDVTTDSVKHLLNFKAMTIKNMPTTPFYSCFGNHDFKTTAYEPTITEEEYLEYQNIGIDISNKNRLQLWNSILIPEQPQYTIHYQDESNEYGKTSYWFEVPTVNGKSDIYAFLSVNYMYESHRDDSSVYRQISINDISIDTTKSGYNDQQKILSPTSEYNVVLEFSAPSQRFTYDYHNVINYNSNHYVRINKLKVVDANGNDVTSLLNSADPYIGIYGADSKYHINGEFEPMTANTGRIEFPLSSKFSNPDIALPVKLYANVDLRLKDNSELRGSKALLKLTTDMPYMQEIMDYVGTDSLNDKSDYDIKIYDNASLLWLKNLIETHPNKRIFIFTHQFFPQKAGGNFGYGYSYCNDNWRISSTECYCLSGIQFEFLNKLNNEYQNTIWFTGHSHYDYDSQITDRYVMICNKDFDIYKPGETGFTAANRYMKRNVTFDANFYKSGLSEYYETSTTNHVDADVLYYDCPMPNGTYNITLWAASVYTPTRGFDSELFTNDSNGYGTMSSSVATLNISGSTVSYNLPSIKEESLSSISESDLIYTFNNVEVIDNKIRIAIHKNAAGTNWFTCGIKSIINTSTDQNVTYKYDDIYTSAFGFIGVNGSHAVTSQSNTPLYMSELYNPPVSDIEIVYKDKQTAAIVTNPSTGYNVHIPSTTRPLASNYGKNHILSKSGDWNSAKKDADSAGMIMDIYEDYVDIRGVSFKLNDWYPGEYINKYHPLGQYRILIPSN